MSYSICIMGESGSGKTTSMRNLPPAETYYIDADGKGLSWRGWRNQYNTQNKNYWKSDDPHKIYKLIHDISDKKPEIKYIVIDTINGAMISDEMRRSKEKGYDKWLDLAQSVYNIVDDSNKLRDDLTVICIAHSETVTDDLGYTLTRIKTSGKKLNKICLESKFTTVLLAKGTDGKYKFETQANNSTAKSPMGMFEEREIDNDIVPVIKALHEF